MRQLSGCEFCNAQGIVSLCIACPNNHRSKSGDSFSIGSHKVCLTEGDECKAVALQDRIEELEKENEQLKDFVRATAEAVSCSDCPVDDAKTIMKGQS